MGLTAFNRMRRIAAARKQELINAEAAKVVASAVSSAATAQGSGKSDSTESTGESGKKKPQLKQMNKAQLTEYGVSLGLSLNDDNTKAEMIEMIQRREEEQTQK